MKEKDVIKTATLIKGYSFGNFQISSFGPFKVYFQKIKNPQTFFFKSITCVYISALL